MEENTAFFSGKPADANSTLMPNCRAWLREKVNDLSNASDDCTVAVFVNCPSIGVFSAVRLSFTLNLVTNLLADFPTNGICFLVTPNKAGQDSRPVKI